MIHDDAVLALISHSAEERLKYLIDQIRSVVKKRLALKKVKSTNDSVRKKSNETKEFVFSNEIFFF